MRVIIVSLTNHKVKINRLLLWIQTYYSIRSKFITMGFRLNPVYLNFYLNSSFSRKTRVKTREYVKLSIILYEQSMIVHTFTNSKHSEDKYQLPGNRCNTSPPPQKKVGFKMKNNVIIDLLRH